MFPIGYFRELSHGQRIPTGRPLANLAQAILGMASQDAVRQLRRGGRVDLSRWIPAFVEAATPIVSVFVREGQRQRARELLGTIEKRRKKSLTGIYKAFGAPLGDTILPSPISFGFDVFNPNVTEFIRNTTYKLVASTLATASEDAVKAYSQLRTALTAGIAGGDTQQEINRRIFAIFHDPDRAARIGQTEALRSMNAGGYMTAIETGVTNSSRWLASSDACPACLDLNGQVREYGKPFYVNPKGGHYAICLFPPRHPHCFCVTTDVLDERTSIDPRAVDRLRSLVYDPGAAIERR